MIETIILIKLAYLIYVNHNHHEEIMSRATKLRKRVCIDKMDPSKTDQSFKNEVNINNIIDRYKKTGLLPNFKERIPLFGDENTTTLYDAFQAVSNAQELFLELPVAIRKEMGHDPKNLESYLSNPENAETLLEYGLTEAKIESKAKNETKTNKSTDEKEKASQDK